MATMIDWNALKTKVASYVGGYPFCTSPKRAFTHVMLEYILSLSPEEIEDAVTDGGNDRGIDAVFVDDRDGRNTIHVFQFKHVSSFERAKRNFPSSEIDKLLSFFSDLLNKKPNMENTCNPILWGKVKEIWQALERPDPSCEVHFCANQADMISTQKERVVAGLDNNFFQINHHSLGSIVTLFLEKRQPKINAELKVVDKNYFERTDGNIRGLIVTLEAEEIIKLVTDPNDSNKVRLEVFNDNARVYLTKKNRVNKKIHATALSDKNVEFWYLNNGITMTCDSFSYVPNTRAPLVTLKNVQIVNGGQTSNALFDAYREDQEKLQTVLVLARIYETKTRDITVEIAEATNSQTPINTRDLRSNDDIQKKLEESFHDQGFYYERKYRQHLERPKNKRIDALKAGQAFLAYTLGYPEIAKKDRAKVFGDMYDNIFNDDITAEKVLVPFRLLAHIENEKRNLQKTLRKNEPYDPGLIFLLDGVYHVLFTVAGLCEEKDIDPSNEEKALVLIPEALKLLKDFVKQEAEVDEAFTTSRFFKDAKTKSKIQRLLATETGSKKPSPKKKRHTKRSK